MHKLTLCLYALCGVLLFAAFARKPALADEPASVTSVPEHATQIDVAQPLPQETLDVEILRALRHWTGQSESLLQPWAAAIADGTRDRREALLLASIGANESHFEPWVLDGRCNDASWRAAQTGWMRTSCDNGWAVGFAQRHSKRLLGASPEEQVRDAVAWLRAMPTAWTTWPAAKAQAEAW